MRKLFTIAAIAVAIVSAGGITEPALARGGPGAGIGGGPMFGSGTNAFTPPGFNSRGNRTGWNGGTVPPGWSHGTKKGWGTGTMPPGLSRH